MATRLPSLLETVRGEVRRREETDRVVSVAWVVAPVLAVVVAFVLIFLSFLLAAAGAPPELAGGFLAGGLGGAIGILFLVGIIFLYLYYVLIKRRNRHFARQTRLLESAVAFLREAAQRQGVDVEARLISMERSLREARDEEGEKGAVLWVVLAFLTGIAALYIYYFLMRDFHRHERRMDGLTEDLNAVLAALGQMELPRRTEPVPKRSFAVYLILTIITLGFFGIYWIYVLIKDPNIHFGEEAKVEAEMVARLEGLVS